MNLKYWYLTNNQGCDRTANCLILAIPDTDTDFVICKIIVNQVGKCFPAWAFGVFATLELSE